MCLVTTDATVRAKLYDEQRRLMAYARDADDEETAHVMASAFAERPLGGMLARALAPLLRGFF